MNRQELHRLARVGAQARLEDLRREMAAIVATFPDLGRQGRAAVAARNGQPKRRKRMSAAARKAISRAQRKRWAAWRKRRQKTPAY